MKKFVLIVLAAAMLLSACNFGVVEDVSESVQNAVENVESLTDSVMPDRVIVLFDARDSQQSFGSITKYVDIDGDGEDELLKIEAETDYVYYDEYDYSEEFIDVTVSYDGHKHVFSGEEDNVFGVSAVYLLDIFQDDNARDILIARSEMGDGAMYTLMNCSSDGISIYDWETVWSDEPLDEYFPGYVDRSNFDIPEDGVLVFDEQSDHGMWDFKVSHIVKDGVISRVDEIEYPVDKYIDWFDWYEDTAEAEADLREYYGMSDEEIEMLKKGYALAHADFENNAVRIDDRYEAIKLKKGDYFKVIGDSFNGWLHIEKLNGEDGWIDLEGWEDNRYDVSAIVFMMAG